MKILCFVGPPGSGKSTIIMKLAARYAFKKKEKSDDPEPIILGFNNWNIAGSFAVEKMAGITGIGYKQITTATDIKKNGGNDNVVFVDMPGSFYNEEIYHELLREVRDTSEKITFILVLDANYSSERLSSLINQYGEILPISALCYTHCRSVEDIPTIAGVKMPDVKYISYDDRIPGDLIEL